ncbi:hypothetical protein [Bacillus mojavensis]|uniref:hypothetical protein n=1 Tax=Bacillus mojavensis TaxID=72360 RepID=UPI00398A7B06
MRYTNSHLEDWIENLYRKIDMTVPEQINFERIAEALDIRLSFKASHLNTAVFTTYAWTVEKAELNKV